MASRFQQQALTRKLIYVFLIVGLFTAALLFRNYVVQPQAEELALREQNVGEVQLSGEAIRLSLTGLRGVASCVLWINAIDRQKKNQWDELRIIVDSITKLQPHFITPWLFQSWNLSYNVAVQCDLPRDKYYYIAEGIQLLAQGERQNRDQPDLRFAMGTYYHQKISMHDHRVPLQTLFEMSMMDPVHRDPAWLKEADRTGRPRYETHLCQEHPRLVRRLREKLGCTTLEQVFEYLQENRKIPSLYGDKVEGEGDERDTPMRLVKDKPFPILPLPPHLPEEKEISFILADLKEMGEDYDALAAARVWYAYAQKPLPKPDPLIPGDSQPIEDLIHQRIPQHMTTSIFRDYPGIGQSALAERIEEEGWFDPAGWRLPRRFFSPQGGEEAGERFKNGEPAVLGRGRKWGEESWDHALRLWTEIGEANHLLMTPRQEADWERQARPFLTKYNTPRGAQAPPLRGGDRDDPAMQQAYLAAKVLAGLSYTRTLTNFKHHYDRAQVEAQPGTVEARKELFEADQLRLAGGTKALPMYETALKKLAKILESSPEFRSNQAIAEDTFELEWNYVQLFQGRTATAPVLKQQLFAQAVLGQAALAGPDLSCLALARLSRPQAVAAPVLVAPLDGTAPDGKPLIDPGAALAVLRRKRLISESTAGPPPEGARGAGGPGRTMPPVALPPGQTPRPNRAPDAK
jgi:hypothetical protein